MNFVAGDTNSSMMTVSPEMITEGHPQQAGEPRVPLTMPRAQQYYWLEGWQRDEQETLEGLGAGEYEDFDGDDPEDAARWLREPDDE